MYVGEVDGAARVQRFLRYGVQRDGECGGGEVFGAVIGSAIGRRGSLAQFMNLCRPQIISIDTDSSDLIFIRLKPRDGAKTRHPNFMLTCFALCGV